MTGRVAAFLWLAGGLPALCYYLCTLISQVEVGVWDGTVVCVNASVCKDIRRELGLTWLNTRHRDVCHFKFNFPKLIFIFNILYCKPFFLVKIKLFLTCIEAHTHLCFQWKQAQFLIDKFVWLIFIILMAQLLYRRSGLYGHVEWYREEANHNFS